MIAILLSGCGAYYNTYYNAQKYFDAGQKAGVKVDGKPTSAAVEAYNNCIKKCGLILTDYKDSKWADNALFLLGKSLYYRGMNQIQCVEKMEDLIRFYPNSEFVPEAKLYIARTKYDMNSKEEAFKLFQDFLTDPANNKFFPECLSLMANYYVKEKDYLKAKSYLTTITEKYNKSPQYVDAYLILGKLAFDNKDYDESYATFVKLLKNKTTKKVALDAKYYIAYNLFYQNQLDDADRAVNKLLKEEYREDNTQKVLIVKARIIAKKDTKEAIRILESVIKNKPKSIISAEAAFYEGDIYFNEVHDYNNAITAYNRVKSEYSQSEYTNVSVTQSAIASRIIQFHNFNTNQDLTTLVNEQFKLAEYYLYEMDLPDSALMVYTAIEKQKGMLISKMDSLTTQIRLMKAKKDSLRSVSDTLKAIVDTTLSIPVRKDSTIVDTTMLIQKKTQIEQNIQNYDQEYLPYSLLVRMYINESIKKDSLFADTLYNELIQKYPQSKYRQNADIIMNKVRVDSMLVYKTFYDRYEKAIASVDSLPLVTINNLKTMVDSVQVDLKWQVMFTIGYTYYFQLQDSTNAKVWFDSLLTHNENNAFTEFIKGIYTGKHFIHLDRLPYILQMEQKEKDKIAPTEEEKKDNKDNKESQTLTKPLDKSDNIIPLMPKPKEVETIKDNPVESVTPDIKDIDKKQNKTKTDE